MLDETSELTQTGSTLYANENSMPGTGEKTFEDLSNLSAAERASILRLAKKIEESEQQERQSTDTTAESQAEPPEDNQTRSRREKLNKQEIKERMQVRMKEKQKKEKVDAALFKIAGELWNDPSIQKVIRVKDHPDQPFVDWLFSYRRNRAQWPNFADWNASTLEATLEAYRGFKQHPPKTKGLEKYFLQTETEQRIELAVAKKTGRQENVKDEIQRLLIQMDTNSFDSVYDVYDEVNHLISKDARYTEYFGEVKKNLLSRLSQLQQQKRQEEEQQRKQEDDRFKQAQEGKEWANEEVPEDDILTLHSQQPELNNAKEEEWKARNNRVGADSSARAAITAIGTKTPESHIDYVEKFYRKKGFEDYEIVRDRVRAEGNSQGAWEQYGWDDQARDAVWDALEDDAFAINGTRLSSEQIWALLMGMVMHGVTGDVAKNTIENIQAASVDPSTQNRMTTEARRSYLRRFLEEHNAVEDIIEDETSLFNALYPTAGERRRYGDEKEHRYQRSPQNLEEFAWQVAYKDEETFGKKSDIYPVFNRMVRTTKNGAIKRLESRDIVNSDNLTMWLRERVNYLDGQKSTEPIDFLQEVRLEKDYSSLTLNKIFEDSHRIFTDQDGNYFGFLDDQWQIEAILYTIVRATGIDFKNGSGGEEDLLKILRNRYMFDILTRPIYKRSLFYWLNILSERYISKKADGKLGATINTLFMAYANIANASELQRVLQVKDLNELFSLDKLQKKREQLFEGKNGITNITGEAGKDVLDLTPGGKVGKHVISDIFNVDKNSPNYGKIINMKKFLDFINMFNEMGKNDQLVTLVREILSEQVAGFYELNTKKSSVNKKIADMMAYQLSWFMGAATQNDTGFQGFNAEVRLSKGYRDKQLMDAERGGAAGSPHTHGQFLHYLVTPMHAITTTSKSPEHGNGRTIYEMFDVLMQKRQEIQSALANFIGTDEEKAKKEQDLLLGYQNLAAQFSFEGAAMKDYYLNHYTRAFTLDKMIRGAEELRFEDYIRTVPDVGVTFDRKKFQDDVQKRLITTARYAFSTYGKLNYNMKIWAWDEHIKKFRKMPLAESLFGYQMLDIPEFWVDGQPHIIDYNKVNAPKGKKELFKRWILTYIAGQMLDYRSLAWWATGLRHDFTFFEEVIDVLRKIPGNIESDPGNMYATEITESFFNEKQLAWFRKIAQMQRWNPFGGGLYLYAFFKGLLLDRTTSKEKGLDVAVSIFMTALLKGL